jgi:hypothetical protein
MYLEGKVTIIKTFGVSQLLYLASVLPTPTQNIISKIDNHIFSFILDNKQDKIKRDVMINTFVNGGLKKNNSNFQKVYYRRYR